MTDREDELLVLPELIERSIGAGPPDLPSPEERLADGRRERRRRRGLGLAGTALGVLVAVGIGAVLSGSTGEHGADGPLPSVDTAGTAGPPVSPTEHPPDVTSDAADAPTARAQRAEHDAQRSMTDSVPATYDALGHLVVKKGWHVLRQVDEPMGLQPPDTSTGLVVTDGTQTRWVLLSWEQAVDTHGHPVAGAFGSSGSSDPAGKGYSRFEDWLASMVELQGGEPTDPLASVGPDDVLRAGPGALVVETRPAPVVAGYTTTGDRMAEVRLDGRTWFVVVRGHGPDAEVIPVDAAVLPEPTFEALVDHLRDQLASGEGVR